MQVRTAKDIGAFIRDQRKKQKLDQAELADKVGVNRRWVLEVEHGKPRAEIGLVLSALEALGLSFSIEAKDTFTSHEEEKIEATNIDAIVENAKRPKS